MALGDVLFFILQCMYLMLPAYFANMAPVMFKRAFPGLAVPLDRGKRWRGKRILGNHKTVRGILVGVVMGMLVAFAQSLLHQVEFFAALSFVDYSQWLFLGLLMGLGALMGDMVKSFFKRRIGVKPGKPFVPFDQLDFVAGALLLSWIVVELTWAIVLTVLTVSILLHILTNHIAFYTGIRKEKW